MRYIKTASRMAIIGAAILALALVALQHSQGVARAQSGGTFDLSWWTVDGGGGESSGGSYTLMGAIGQHDAGVQVGGDYTLVGGFWGGAVFQYQIYLPLVVRGF